MKSLLLLTAAMALGTTSAHAGDKTDVEVNTKDKYEAGPSEYFTGDVTVGSFFESGENDYKGAVVNFEKGARTNWHTHPRGQTLVVTAGEGRVQAEGKAVQVIRPGDTVWIPAGVRHWHGAAPHSTMTHIAIQTANAEGKVVDWQDAVTDKEYKD